MPLSLCLCVFCFISPIRRFFLRNRLLCDLFRTGGLPHSQQIFVCSFYVAPITLPDKVLVHLVLPRCEVVSIQLVVRESAPHLSIHDCIDVDFPSLFFSLGHALCNVTTIAKSQFFSKVGIERNTRGWARSSYQTALIPCKES